jgi:uridine kinase
MRPFGQRLKSAYCSILNEGIPMTSMDESKNTKNFTRALYEKMRNIVPGIGELELYEFSYALENLEPVGGWDSVEAEDAWKIETLVESRDFYEAIQSRNRVGGKLSLDPVVTQLTQMLFAGLAYGLYPEKWIDQHFFFDIRAFLFFHRTHYFMDEIIAHFGGKPFFQFEEKQCELGYFQGIGYKDFKSANAEIDHAFIESILKLVEMQGTPILLTLAGPTAAGKTEIMERLHKAFEERNKRITTVEMDNFFLDRDLRGDKPVGVTTTHFEWIKRFLREITQGKIVYIPRYDFIKATSSHDKDGNLRPGCSPIKVEPADIIFIEGNFPFQMEEISSLIKNKIVYLTDDPVRLKRKWKRDIDYRKKYDPAYFINRYFKTQFLRAEDIYLPLMKVCDMVVDTTGAALWVTPVVARLIG